MVRDCEALFNANDSDGTGLLSRGALTEVLRTIRLEEVMGAGFRPTAQLAFDAHSADSHFLSLVEFKRLYYLISQKHPQLLPRPHSLTIHIPKAKGLPAADVNGRSDPFASVQVKGKPESRSQTSVIKATLEPEWHKEPGYRAFSDLYAYEAGDKLEFVVYDYDKPTGGKLDARGQEGEVLGRAELASEQFHKMGGFQGWLPLIDLPPDAKKCNPYLYVKVVYNFLEPEPSPEPTPEPDAPASPNTTTIPELSVNTTVQTISTT
jgi:hypothetical protein